jgi:hypothetical protein
MESSTQRKDKEPIVSKPPNSYPFYFLHLEIEKPPPYVGDIWVPILHVNSSRSVKTYILGMEKWFRPRDKLIKVEHVSVTL